MGRFRRILYLERRPRGSAKAFSCAVQVAAEHGARLTLAGLPGDGVGGEGRGPRQRRLRRMAEAARVMGVPVGVRVLSGAGAAGLATEVGRGHDLVVTVSPWAGPVWPFRLDATMRCLLRRVPCPVWILQPVQSPDIRVVVAAVDVSSPETLGLARGVLGAAATVAVDAGAELRVVHCWSVLGESLLASRSRGGSPRGAGRVLASAFRERRRRVEGLLEDVGLPASTRVVLRKGTAVSGIRDAAWRSEADVVVVGTAGRSGLGGLFPGNTAERLLGRVPASVLVVPAGAPGGAPAGVLMSMPDRSRTAPPSRPRHRTGPLAERPRAS